MLDLHVVHTMVKQQTWLMNIKPSLHAHGWVSVYTCALMPNIISHMHTCTCTHTYMYSVHADYSSKHVHTIVHTYTNIHKSTITFACTHAPIQTGHGMSYQEIAKQLSRLHHASLSPSSSQSSLSMESAKSTQTQGEQDTPS